MTGVKYTKNRRPTIKFLIQISIILRFYRNALVFDQFTHYIIWLIMSLSPNFNWITTHNPNNSSCSRIKYQLKSTTLLRSWIQKFICSNITSINSNHTSNYSAKISPFLLSESLRLKPIEPFIPIKEYQKMRFIISKRIWFPYAHTCNKPI